MRINFETNKIQDNWSFTKELDQKIIEPIEGLDGGDELFRRTYWIKDWHIMIMTNERLIILDTNLTELKNLGQSVSDFDPKTYSWSLMT